MSELDNPFKVAILGSGPAGVTAAIYASRANLNPALVCGIERGGQLMITTEVENYPGFPEGIQGPDMMELLIKQAKRFETSFFEGNVREVSLKRSPFTLNLEDGREVQSQTLIIATGASARWLGLESEKKFNCKFDRFSENTRCSV